ncbi:hypothetical protein DICPUDRAFT_157955 [Dictyostelium purpureum]|uniref:Uncharacterized protein n=1 Tax=Dictyostelium purpureum TaxID=5786 RepID=F1A0G1_DICPU|nr:uncharacterized protein DICPUDRAFT_157955 [Dictyostelium purpureum]EGC30326.1 hypothetical protein DICPUDRAFT_157955 [Dictyostelium purpureum]|eukprot:XP_003293149.1 hypothetical protein DICPUDRAFT_157955 [Dictyostelium purpureum]
MAQGPYTIDPTKEQKNIKTNKNPQHTSINIENLSSTADGWFRIVSESFPAEEDFIDPNQKFQLKKKYNGHPITIVNLGKTQLKVSAE